jgi:hypothetical protein
MSTSVMSVTELWILKFQASSPPQMPSWGRGGGGVTDTAGTAHQAFQIRHSTHS